MGNSEIYSREKQPCPICGSAPGAPHYAFCDTYGERTPLADYLASSLHRELFATKEELNNLEVYGKKISAGLFQPGEAQLETDFACGFHLLLLIDDNGDAQVIKLQLPHIQEAVDFIKDSAEKLKAAGRFNWQEMMLVEGDRVKSFLRKKISELGFAVQNNTFTLANVFYQKKKERKI